MRCSFGRLMIGIPSVDESDWIATYRPALWTPISTHFFECSWTPSRIVGIANYGGNLGFYLDTLVWMLLDSFWASSGPFLGYLMLLAAAVGSTFTFGTKFFPYPGLGGFYLVIPLFQQVVEHTFLKAKTN